MSVKKVKAVLIALHLVVWLAFPFVAGSSKAMRQPVDDNYQIGTAAISDINFSLVAQQITGLKDPTFRAFLRARILGWLRSSIAVDGRQAALAVAAEGLSDLCSNQDDIWTP